MWYFTIISAWSLNHISHKTGAIHSQSIVSKPALVQTLKQHLMWHTLWYRLASKKKKMVQKLQFSYSAVKRSFPAFLAPFSYYFLHVCHT